MTKLLFVIAIIAIPYCAMIGNDKVDTRPSYRDGIPYKGYEDDSKVTSNELNIAYSKLYKHMVKYGY